MTPGQVAPRALRHCALAALTKGRQAAVRPYVALLVIAFMAYHSQSMGAGKPTVFNHTAGPLTDLDKLVHQHYGTTYNVVDVTDDGHTYVGPTGVGGFGTPVSAYVHDHCISGRALVLYIVKSTGDVSSPYVVRLSDALLERAAVQSVNRFRFRPAQLDGKPVSAAAASMLTFTCPTEQAQ